MKHVAYIFFSVLGILLSIATISSCSRNQTLEGEWEANPIRLNLPGASNATATVSVDFGTPAQSMQAGSVMLTAVINLDEEAFSTAPSIERPWQNSISATASITGQYVRSDNDDNDIAITLDPSSLIINVDSSGVQYDRNVLTGEETQVLDSLNAATISRWRVVLSQEMQREFAKFNSIEDIKIHHGELMSAEIDGRDITLRKVGIQ